MSRFISGGGKEFLESLFMIQSAPRFLVGLVFGDYLRAKGQYMDQAEETWV